MTLFTVFSVITTLNFYYTAALAPAVAALIGMGIAAAWSRDQSTAAPAGQVERPGRFGRAGRLRLASHLGLARRPGLAVRLGLAIVVAGTAAYAAFLVPSSGAPGWLIPAVAGMAAAAVGVVAWSAARRDSRLLAAALGTGLATVLLAPAVACVGMAANHQGAFDTPFEPPRVAQTLADQAQLPETIEPVIAEWRAVADGTPYLMAAQTTAIPELTIYITGQEALPIGGFDGTTPSPTLNQLRADIRQGRVRLVWVASTTDPRLRWIVSQCSHVVEHQWECAPANAG